LLDCACFIDPTAFAVHPQFTALAIDGKGFTTFVAVNKLIHAPSLLGHTDIAKSNGLVVFALRRWGSLFRQFFLHLQILKTSLAFFL
jgi:hypothetical protein